VSRTEIVREFLAGLAGRPTPLGDDDSLVASGFLDSLKVAAFVAFLEERFAVTLDADDVTPENLDSIAAVEALLSRKGAS